MFLSTEAFFDDGNRTNIALLVRAKTDIPAEFVRLYKKNVVGITPMKTGALRRSIITRQLGGTAEIAWRSPYAGTQNVGGHTVASKRVVNIDGRFVTLQPGFYRYRNYTTAGTGPNFAGKAFQATQAQMPAALRGLGLIK